MLFRRCCYCLPLRTGCIIIGIVFICLFLIEMIIHGQSGIFIYYKPAPWDYVQGIILSWGIVSSVLLIYGAYKENRCLHYFWLLTFSLILLLYVAMSIVDAVLSKMKLIILIGQIAIELLIIYSLMIVHANYKELKETQTTTLPL